MTFLNGKDHSHVYVGLLGLFALVDKYEEETNASKRKVLHAIVEQCFPVLS